MKNLLYLIIPFLLAATDADNALVVQAPSKSLTLTTDPTFPLAHGVTTVNRVLVKDKDGKVVGSCAYDATNLTACELPSPINSSNTATIEIYAGAQGAPLVEASPIQAGVVTTGTQSFAGNKTFTDVTTILNGVDINHSFGSGGISEALKFTNGTTGVTGYLQYDNSSAFNPGTVIGSTSSISFATDYTEGNDISNDRRMVITTDGYVGINTPAPGARTHITHGDWQSAVGTLSNANIYLRSANQGFGLAMGVGNAGLGSGVYLQTATNDNPDSGIALNLNPRGGTVLIGASDRASYDTRVVIGQGVAGNQSWIEFATGSTGTLTPQMSAGYFNGTFRIATGSGVLTAPRLQISQANGDVFGTHGTYHTASDRRLKTDLETIESPLEKIEQLQGYTFKWIEDFDLHDNKRFAGLMAQDVEKVLPEAVNTQDNDQGTKAIMHDQLSALYVESIKALIEQNKQLIKRIEALEAAQ